MTDSTTHELCNLALCGFASVADMVGDRIVYRNLMPADRRLPGIADLRRDLGLPPGALPRKSEPDYGRVVAEILRQAQAQDRPGTPIRELVFIGDTRLLDGTAFSNLCAAGGWPGWAFIGQEATSRPPEIKTDGPIYVANRWAALSQFLDFVCEQGWSLDEHTALVIDMDKTMIGARGRNDKVIDLARVEGVRRTIAGLLGPHFDLAAFQTAYDELNRPPYHPFTADNQDYLAYICLILGGGLITLDTLIADVRAGRMANFGDFIAQVHRRRDELSASGLTDIHDQVWQCVQAGDPTPFKAFRHNEYLTTAARFGDLPGATVSELLEQRIVITSEVQLASQSLRQRGTLIFALSDKPDEASCPSAEQAQAGHRPLHRLETWVVGHSEKMRGKW